MDDHLADRNVDQPVDGSAGLCVERDLAPRQPVVGDRDLDDHQELVPGSASHGPSVGPTETSGSGMCAWSPPSDIGTRTVKVSPYVRLTIRGTFIPRSDRSPAG